MTVNTDIIHVPRGTSLGLHEPNFINNGWIIDNGAVEITGQLSGDGRITVGGNAILTLDNKVGNGERIALAGQSLGHVGALLVSTDIEHFQATIEWGHGAQIEVNAEVASATFADHMLTLHGPAGEFEGAFRIAGSHASADFGVMPGQHSYITA